MASERAPELLRQILASPDDLALRSVYADELQARGDPRGEFVALELAGDRSRAEAMFDQYASVWWPHLLQRWIKTRNGFVEGVAGSPAQLAAATAMFASEPIRDVEVLGVDGVFGGLDLATLRPRRLAVRGRVPIAELFPIDSIEVLDLAASDLRRVPAWQRAFPRCRELTVANNPHASSYLPQMLAGWTTVPRLERLDLSRIFIIPERLDDLLGLGWSSLRELRLSNNVLGARGAKVVLDSLSRLPKLDRLAIIGCGFELPASDRIELVQDVPDVIAIEVGHHTLALHRRGADRWTIELDGTQRMLQWQSIARGDDRDDRVLRPWQIDEAAPLDGLARALITGATCELETSGCRIDLGSDTGYVYSSAVFQQEIVHVDFESRGAMVYLTFESYTTIEQVD